MALKKNLDEMTEEEIDARIAELQGTGGSGVEENTPAPKPIDEMTEDEVDARIAELQAGQSGAEEGETVEPPAPQRRQPEVVRRGVNGLSDEEHWRKGNLSTGEYVSLKTKMAGLEPFEVTDTTGNVEGMVKTVGNLAVNALARPFANFRQMRQQQLMRGFEDDGAGGQRKVAEMSDAEQDFLADEAGMNGWRGAARHLLGNLFGNVSRPKVGKDGKLTMEWERTNEPTPGKKAVRWLFSSDDEDTPLKVWDRMEGVKYQDDAERRAARAKYLQDLAGQMVEMNEVEKENARREFKGRNPTEDVDMLGELVVQGAYTLPFAVDRTGLLAGAISAASRYGELKSDKYAFDKDGNMVVAERRDTNDLGAATKATLGAAAEVGVEKVGGELATGAASKLLKATIGRIPLVSETAKGLAATEAGQAISQFLRRYRVLASRTGFNSLPAEVVEEFEQDLIDKGLGIGERESAKEGTDIASRAAEATAEFWDPKNLWNLTKSMVGLMVVQGGAAHAADRLGSRRIDAVLEKGLGLDADTVRSYTKGEKQVAFEAWLNGMDEKEVATTFKDGAKYINRLVKEIGDTAGRSDFGTASEVKFTVPTNGDGNALWNRATDESGRPCLRIADEKAGVTVDEYELHDGSTVYRVYDKAGNRMSADSKDAALAAADRLATKSALRAAKIEFIEGMKGRMFDGVNVFYGDTIKDVMQGIREEYGEDALKSLTDSKEFRQGAATGQAFHFQNDAGEDCVAFVLDNIRDADDAMTAANHEVLGHTGIGAAVENKGAFLAKMDAAGLDPADRRNFEDEVSQQMRERGLASREDVFKDPQAAEELFAYVAENIRRGGNASLKNKFVAAVRAVVREKFGRDLKFNGDDIYAMIDRGRAKIEQGKGGKSVTGKAGVQQDADTDFALVRSDDQRAAQDEEAARQQREAEAERLQHEANALRVMDEDQARDAALEKEGGPQEVADYRLYYQQERLHADLVADSFPELFADFCETRHMRTDDPQSRVFFYRAVLEGQKMRPADKATIDQTMRGETGETAKPTPEPGKPKPTPAPQPATKPAKPAKGGEKGPDVGGSVDELRQILEKTEIGRAILTNYETAVADDPAFAEAQFQRSVKANAEDLGLETHENGPLGSPSAGGTTSRPEGAASGKAASTPQSGDSGKTNGAEGLEVTELKPITAKSASHNFDRVKRNLIGALRSLATARGKDGAAKAEAAFKKALADFTAAPSSLWRFRVRDTATGDVFKFDLDARIDRKTQTLNREQVAGLVSRAAPGVNFKVAKKVANRLCDELDPLVPGHVAASYAAKVNNPKGYEKNFTRAVDAYVEANPDSLLASFVGQFGNRVTPKMLAQVFAQDATVDADLLAEQDAEAGRKTWDTELENWAAESGRFGPRREDGSYDFSGVYEQLVKELAEANADTRTVEERRADAEREEAERAEFQEARERAAEEESYDFEGEAEVRQAYDDLLAEATVRDQRDNPVGSLADIPDGELFSLGEDEYEMIEHLDGGAVVVEEFRDFDDIRRYVVTPREGGVDVKEVTDGGRDGEAGGAGVRGSQDREGDTGRGGDLEGRGRGEGAAAGDTAREAHAAGHATGGAASRAADSVGGAQAEGGTLTLASASAEEIAAEEARNRRRRIIGMRQAAPLKGGGTPWQETELGSQGAGGQMELQFRRAAANNADAKNGNAFKPNWRISRLYTGSAADYEKPSLHHVGTGEGSQVYGWGLYASDQRGVAESYAFSESSKANPDIALKLNGRKIDWTYWEKNVKEDDYSSYKSIANLLAANGGNVDKVISDLEPLIKNGWISIESVDWLKSNKSNVSYSGKSGNVYEQTFFTNRAPGDESHLLKWYEPVSEENLNRILDQGEKEKGDDFLFMLDEQRTNGENASDIYNGLVRIFGSPQAASEFLARADIDGIKYPVDSYGGKTVKDGDKVGWNYVSFRDDNITVDHKWTDGELQFRQPRFRDNPEARALSDALGLSPSELAALGFSASRNFDEGREERADRAARTRNAAELDLVRNHGRILSPGGMKAAMTSLREWTQDYLIRLRNLEEQLGVGRDLSAYYAADRAYGLVTDKAARFQKEMVEPLMRELEAAGVTDPEGFADFGQYLVARHGREYNEMIAQRSPLVAQALEDRRTKALAQGILAGVTDLDDANIANFQALLGWSDAETARFRRDVSGSSKSTAYWARLLDQYRADGRAARYAAAERIVRDMTKAVREELVATGRLSRAQADAWERLSPNYVPMMHDEEEDIDLWSRFFWSAEGAGGSRRGGNAYREAEIHHAFGRTTMPDNPVPFVVQMYQSAIQRGADNLARKALADIVRAQEAKLATDPDAPQVGRVFRYMGEEERKEAQKKVGSLEAAVAAGTATPTQQAELARLRTALAESANAGAAIPFTEVVGANGMTYRVPKVSSIEAENPDIVAFKEDGELKFVKLGIADSQKQVEKGWLASSDAAAIGAALKKQTLVHHWLIDGLRRVTATFSALRTAWSPTFLVSNWTADNAQAARNLYATFGAAGAAKFEHFVFARNSFGAARAVLNDNYGTSLIQRYAKEWAENGGRIGGMATENFADIQRKFDRQLRAMTSQFRHLAGIRSWGDAMTYVGDRMNGLKEFSEHWNSVVEMSTRIAAYATYREMTKGNGKSDAENIADAVSYSRDITVNFNRKGRLTPLLNAWWAFSNASIQDLQRSFQAFGERRYGAAVGGVAGLAARTGLKMGAGLFILGFLSSMLGFGQDDPEEEKEGKAQWKDTKEYVKQNKMAFRIGDRTFSIPVRGLSRLPYYLGHVAYEMFTGRRSAAKAASDVVGLAGDNLTDVMGSTDSWTQWFLPSVIRPGSEIVRNRTFTGSTMYRESRTAYDVKSNMGRTNTAPAWHTVAKLLNRLGGGENRGAFGGKSDRGSDLPLVGRAFDQQPEKLEAVWNWLGGSAMKDLGQIAGTVKDVFGFMAGQGWNRKVRNVPFASRVMANLDENSARFHEAENSYRKARAEAESFDPDATEEIARFVEDHPWAARENRRWGQELKDLSNMASNLMSQEMKAQSDEEREAIHKMRLGVQYLFLHRLETDPRTDGPEELRFERERSREADRALKAAKREQKRAQKREQRGRGRMLLK